MSYMWWKPACENLEGQIKNILQEQVKPYLNENNIAKTIIKKVEALFRLYEKKWAVFYITGCIISFISGWVLG